MTVHLGPLLILVAFCVVMGLGMAWACGYSLRSQSRNGWGWFTLTPLMGLRDTTRGAYARQVKEHARLNDQHAAELMARPNTAIPMPVTETRTEIRIEP